MTKELAKKILWDRCQHTPETAEAIRILSEDIPQGEWIKNTETVFKNRFNCSICGKLIFEPKEDNNYCSNCGAKMNGG